MGVVKEGGVEDGVEDGMAVEGIDLGAVESRAKVADPGVGGGAACGGVGAGVGVGAEVAIAVGNGNEEGTMVSGDGEGRLAGLEKLATDGDGVGTADGEQELGLAGSEVGSVATGDHSVEKVRGHLSGEGRDGGGAGA